MLPATYSWLSKEKSPLILVEALKLYGTTEVVGRVHNPDIMGWSKELGGAISRVYVADEIPWCGLFIAICVKRAEYTPVNNALWALSWSAWGAPVRTPMLGDVLTFTRKGGGHVGLYVGEDVQAYHVLGGNQSNAVNVTRIAKQRLYTARRSPWKKLEPPNIRRVWLQPTGSLSTNEA